MMTYINVVEFVLISQLEKDNSMIEARRLKNVVIFIPLMNTWRVYSTETILSENHRAALEGKWVPGGGIETLRNYKLFR